jgi:hypothetical protein
MKTLSLFEKLSRAVSGPVSSSRLKTNEPVRNVPGTHCAGPAEVELVLGIDLGTSCSKVVIADMVWRNVAWAVPFDASLPGIAAYLHPTKTGGENNLKMRLMDNPCDPHLQNLVVECLVGIIRRAFAWFEKHASGPYAGRRLSWTVSLGYPAKSLDDSTLKQAYEGIAKDAVRLGMQSKQDALASAMVDAPVLTDLYPEIAAQLAGYVRSPYRKSGNLLLVDVGAGTLDVSTLILSLTATEDLVSFQVCKVEELGALRLHQRRLEAVEAIDPGAVGRALGDFQDGTAALPEVLEGMVQQPTPCLRRAFDNATECFAERVLETIVGCFATFRKRLRDGHQSSGFDPIGRNVRLMVTGGGSRAAFYQRLFQEGLGAELLRYNRWEVDPARRTALGQGVLQEVLPIPYDIQNFPEALRADFDRLSVAYGLALGRRNLMRVMCTRENGFGVRPTAEGGVRQAA